MPYREGQCALKGGATGPLGSKAGAAVPFCMPPPDTGEGNDWAVMRKGNRTSLKTVSSWAGCSSTAVVLAWVLVCLQRDTHISRQATPELSELSAERARDYTQRLGMLADSGHTAAS